MTSPKSGRPSTRRFFPLAQWREQPQPGHGRIDQRHIEILPANALSQYMRNAWPTINTIARVTRNRQHVRAGKVTKSETETTYLISSISAPTPETILRLNRNHWQIEIMHRDKDVTMGEDHLSVIVGQSPVGQRIHKPLRPCAQKYLLPHQCRHHPA